MSTWKNEKKKKKKKMKELQKVKLETIATIFGTSTHKCTHSQNKKTRNLRSTNGIEGSMCEKKKNRELQWIYHSFSLFASHRKNCFLFFYLKKLNVSTSEKTRAKRKQASVRYNLSKRHADSIFLSGLFIFYLTFFPPPRNKYSFRGICGWFFSFYHSLNKIWF